MTKKDPKRKKYGILPPNIAESDTQSLGHGLCRSGGSIYNKDTSKNKLSACTHNDRSRNETLVGLKLLKPQISQQYPSKIFSQKYNTGWFEIVKATNKSATSI
jgi:hypothetical protein